VIFGFKKIVLSVLFFFKKLNEFKDSIFYEISLQINLYNSNNKKSKSL